MHSIFLTGGDWGDENCEHSHAYELELRLTGSKLDRHNYLVDLLDIEKILDSVTGKYRDSLLNSFPGFKGLNPSLELFSRILADEISNQMHEENIESVEVKLWENEEAWASWTNKIK